MPLLHNILPSCLDSHVADVEMNKIRSRLFECYDLKDNTKTCCFESVWR